MRMIDADALIREINPMGHNSGWYSCEYIMGAINAMPTITAPAGGAAPGQWISVRDGMPEGGINPLTMDFRQVICCVDFGGKPRRRDIRAYGYGKACWSDEAHFWHGGQIMDGVVTHWMPMPKPPETPDLNGGGGDG